MDHRILSTLLLFLSVSSASLCTEEAYSLGISQKVFVGRIVNDTVDAIISETSPIKRFFDGTIPIGSIYFTDPGNTAYLNALKSDFISYFALEFQCNDSSIHVYQGDPNMRRLHMHMPISLNDFETFVDTMLEVSVAIGVSQNGVQNIRDVLTTNMALICNQPGCLLQPNTTFTTNPETTAEETMDSMTSMSDSDAIESFISLICLIVLCIR
jgi:hypothetical protein